jgi:hypothetical protein
MYVVAKKTKIPLKEVDEKEGFKVNLFSYELEVSPWALAGVVALILFVVVMIYLSLSAVDTKPPVSAILPAAAATLPAVVAPKLKAPKAGGKKGKGKKGQVSA